MKHATAALVALLLAVAACGGDVAPDTTTGATHGAADDTLVVQPPVAGWVLVSGEVGGIRLDPPDTHRITLLIDDVGIGGQAACNGYGGAITVEGDTATISDLAWTEMACQPASVMDVEQLYLAGLTGVEGIETTADRLVLRGTETELVFEPLEDVDDEAIIDTVWTLDTLIDGDTASSVAGDPATLLLTSDGRLEGSTGCRDLVGTYVIEGDEVVVPELAAIGSCGSRLLPQDGHVLEVVGDWFTTSVDGNQLTLSSQGGVGLGYSAG